MEETPVKSRVRRKRGEGRERSETTGKVDELLPGIARAASPVPEEDDDELGPTPSKPVAGFHSLFETEGSSSRPGGGTNGQSASLMTRLLSAGGKGKQRSTDLNDSTTTESRRISEATGKGDASETSRSHSQSDLTYLEEDQSLLPGSDADGGDWNPTSPAEPTRTRQPERPEKILSISDDEIDEWDPEANHIRHRVKIIPTRSRPKKGDWSDDDDLEYQTHQPDVEASSEDDQIDDSTPALDDTTTSQTNLSLPSPPPTMSLLSLTSPNHRQGRYAKLKELRYKALFNPTGLDAQRLKAFQKGQEAFQSGETEANDEEEDLHALEQDGEERGEMADDDWESESEGWKRTGVEMDDDAW